jgi:glycosyltransferase involved in cell wall biosynthesis
MNPSKVIIVTVGQPSTNPRTMKEVEALTRKGIKVKVFYGFWTRWAKDTDRPLMKDCAAEFVLVGGDPDEATFDWWMSRITHKLFRLMSAYIPGARKYAVSRISFALARIVKKEKADLFIAHNLGALPAAALAARSHKSALGFDAEDYHRGQYDDPHSQEVRNTIALENEFIPACDYVTAASPLIAAVYQRLYPRVPVFAINNVFEKKYLQPFRESHSPGLSLFWFSQRVGPDRGLEVIIDTLNLLRGHDLKLYLLGECSPEYKNELLGRAENKAAITFLDPVPSAGIFSIAARFDVGLCTEIPLVRENRDICLANKLFTYLLAGNCIIASETQAQKKFWTDYPGMGFLFRHDDPGHLAAQLQKIYNDRSLLEQCRKRCLDLAASTLN